jgi:hypothetical protein
MSYCLHTTLRQPDARSPFSIAAFAAQFMAKHSHLPTSGSLFGSESGRQHRIKRYPMAVPCSLDYGSVNLDVTHDRQNFTVKINPRIVHVIKSFNSSLQSSISRTLSGVRNQFAAALGCFTI